MFRSNIIQKFCTVSSFWRYVRGSGVEERGHGYCDLDPGFDVKLVLAMDHDLEIVGARLGLGK